jgi:allantoin racemase
MHLVYINPNATKAMTEGVVEVARSELPNAQITGLTNFNGPSAIQGPEDGDASIPGVLELLKTAQDLGADAIVIACFDDTGLAQAQEAADCPVYGIGQSAYIAGSQAMGGFSIVTSLQVSVPVIEANIKAQGFTAECRGVHASDLAVLEIDAGTEQTRAALAASILTVLQSDGCGAVILGCAGMSVLLHDLERRTGATLLDGVRASTRIASAAAAKGASG